ncbi:ligase-associated DNA damage response endonuclease PdeM [Beijerinckia mobilis]|uniref:ligase-associated DNA damage response endonuclease PdeM n=1 Tax=Beijerinckia mobilis TaxID=231434 RepID=UPI00068FB3CB|nr:ligase-associated DNA damage response endonuclease PdeM [Beijerinckia mobilis]
MKPHSTQTPIPAVLTIAGRNFLADPAGALFLEEDGALIIADLHLEKGSAYASRRVFLPPYDTRQILATLAQLIRLYRPRLVVALGDSFHDTGAGERLGTEERALLASLQQGRDWIWIAGNHDSERPDGIGGQFLDDFSLGAIRLRHICGPLAEGAGELTGHLHPVAKVRGRGGLLRRRCFLSDGRRSILPAFGAYAGGLNIRDEAFSGLFATAEARAHVLGARGVYPFPLQHCLPE